ncbi:hypothetical protein VTN00DRAFT_1063 [Thermoascus crustaceus]|uniref:uncharacterized protein n=1 Tax=Thermoascus crustaceus TaxID=5088 RepID=UPI0037431F7B
MLFLGEATLGFWLATTPVAFLSFLLGWVVYQRFLSPYAGIPGPFWASISRFWYLQRIRAGDMHRVTKELHRIHGPIVRIAPNEVSISDPAAMKAIYNVKAGYTKTDFYSTQAPNLSPHGDSFTQLDEQKHTFRRRMINSIFSMSQVREAECYIDNATQMFMKRMGQFADSGEVFDLSPWLHMYTFDVIGELFFGRMFGFLNEGKDIGGYMGAIDIFLPHAIKMAVIPAWMRHFQVLLVPFSRKFRDALKCFNALTADSIRYVDERVESKATRTDMLEKLLKISRERAPAFDITDVYTESYTAIFAGSDTTAIAMRCAIYYLCKNPRAYRKVQAEIDQFHREGKLSPMVTYEEANAMPYVIATIKDAMRIFPSIALTFPRHVPEGGREICGRYFPAGCRVGVNPFVLHFDKTVFGEDAEVFNPDRWFRPEAKEMNSFMFQFGHGSRECIGKNIAIMEQYKFLPQFLRAFHVELANPDKKWEEDNKWFVKQTGIDVRLRRREVLAN